MSPDDEVDRILEHYGVKGMKWGVHRARQSQAANRQKIRNAAKVGGLVGKHLEKKRSGETEVKKIAKADKKFEKTALNSKDYFAAYNHMADRMNSTEINRINNMPKFRNRNMTNMNDPITKAYHAEYNKTTTRILNEYASKNFGTNASGTRKVQFDYDVLNDGMPRMMIVDVDVKHAGLDGKEIEVTWDSQGYILNIQIPEDLAQSIKRGKDFLEHIGLELS